MTQVFSWRYNEVGQDSYFIVGLVQSYELGGYHHPRYPPFYVHFHPSSSELNSKTNVFATSKQGFWDLNSKLKHGICYPIYLNDTAISELTNKKYNVTGKGIFLAGASPDVMLILGSGNAILTGRFYSDQDPALYITRGETVL